MSTIVYRYVKLPVMLLVPSVVLKNKNSVKTNPVKVMGPENVNVHSMLLAGRSTELLIDMVTWGVDQTRQLKDVYT